MSPIYKRDRVELESQRHRGGATHAHASDAAPARSARLIEIGGVVRAIEFTCACGERTVLELEFDGAVAPPPSGARHA